MENRTNNHIGKNLRTFSAAKRKTMIAAANTMKKSSQMTAHKSKEHCTRRFDDDYKPIQIKSGHTL